MYERILITTDGTELSKKAVDAGLALAAKLGAEVIVYTSVPRYPHLYFEGAVVVTPAEAARIETDWNHQAQLVVNDVVQQAQAKNVKATAVMGHGAVAEGIISTAKKHQCDLVVMASHGRKGISRMLLGSETLDVLTHCHIPVMILR
jgi:nucleotide-binding universal stress UspA family protein